MSTVRRAHDVCAGAASAALVLLGLLMLVAAIEAGCTSSSRITPASSTASREIDDTRPRTVWRVRVEPGKEIGR